MITETQKLELELKLVRKYSEHKSRSISSITGSVFFLILLIYKYRDENLRIFLFVVALVFFAVGISILIYHNFKFENKLSILNTYHDEFELDEEDKLRKAIGLMTKAEEVTDQINNSLQV